MNLANTKDHISAYHRMGQTVDAANYIVHNFQLTHPNFDGFEVSDELFSLNTITLIAKGTLGGKQRVFIPKNLFAFDLNLVLNMIAHEMLHVRQKDPKSLIEDKNEREWQAYHEMLFHRVFPQIPNAPVFNQIQFAKKALEYYRRMGEGSLLQTKYLYEKLETIALLESFEQK